MKPFGLILSRDLSDLSRTTAFRILAAILIALSAASAVGTAALLLAPAPDMAAPNGGARMSPIGTMLYFATFLPFLVLLWVFAGAILTKEKASGHLETLLATPLRPRTLWLAKTSVIVLPGLGMAFLSAVLIVVSTLVVGSMGHGAPTFVFSLPLLLVCALGNPLLFSGLAALTVLLAMVASPDAAIVPSFVLGFGLLAAIPIGAALGFIDLSSWAFTAAYLGAGVAQWIAVLILGRGLTKERIVLSSRSD